MGDEAQLAAEAVRPPLPTPGQVHTRAAGATLAPTRTSTPTPTPNPNPNQVLSAFHGAQLPKHAAPYAFRTANGLDPAAIVDGPNARDRFIYASSASAGLLLLLQVGPNLTLALAPTLVLALAPHPSP